MHELAHQWVGDHLTVAEWRHIWLNEGFATYTEWLWSEQDGRDTAQEIFDSLAAGIPADHPFWTVVIGHPQSADLLFDIAVYLRGAMTLHALRQDVGDRKFFRIVRTWVREQGGGHVTIEEFIRTAERVSRMQLDELFETWLFTPAKPAGIEPVLAGARSTAALSRSAAALLARFPKH